MNKLYVGLNITDNMFPANCKLTRQTLTQDEVKTKLKGNGYQSCCPSQQKPLMQAVQKKTGLEIDTPANPSTPSLSEGDSILCLNIRGLTPGQPSYTE